MWHSDIGKYLYAPWLGECRRRTSEDGRAGECQKGTGKEQGGKVRFIKNVSGNLIYGEFVRSTLAGHFFM